MTVEDRPELVDLIVEYEGWNAVRLKRIAETSARATLRHLELDPDGYEVSLLAGSDNRIAELNEQFRGKPVPTNVLSWPAAEAVEEIRQGDESKFLGDLAIAFGVCTREAEESGATLEDHVAHLIVHGVLHLFGYDHIKDDEADEMELIESHVLAGIGIANPYQ